jgi:hypothetical protein
MKSADVIDSTPLGSLKGTKQVSYMSHCALQHKYGLTPKLRRGDLKQTKQ